LIQDEERTADADTDGNEDETSAAPEADTSPEGSSAKTKAKRGGGDKSRRSHAERAMANIRSAKKGQREVSDPVERARFMLAEANVLALLELADAISGGSGAGADGDAASD
jgi:hypothetical protein